jgi:hypothetical protein
MYASIYLLPPLLFSLIAAATTPHRQQPQRPISFSPPSQHPILTSLPRPPSGGTVSMPSYSSYHSVPVTYSLSPQLCLPMVPECPSIIEDLSQRLFSEHLNGLSFPYSSDPQSSPLPIYLVANITEQLYRSKFVLSLSLKLSPLKHGLKDVGTPRWRSIIGLLAQSAQQLHGCASVFVLEAEIEEVDVLAEWRLWRIVDGLPRICES